MDENGKEIKVIEETDWQKSYVGDTIDAKAKDTELYDDPAYAGIYLVPDDYSKTMVLETDREDNILTFRYKIPGKHYTVEYKDIDSRIEILPKEEIQTKLSQVTVGMKEISGWTYQGYTVDDSELAGGLDSTDRHVTVTVTNDGVVVTFWYQRIPIDNTIRALKLLDNVALTEGTWFHFELVDEEGKVVKTAQSVNGFIDFDLAELKLDKAGTYKYTLREKNDGGNFKYDDTVYDVEVVVTQPGDGFRFELEGGKGILNCDKHIHTAGCYNRKLACGQEEGPDHTHSDGCYVLICGREDDPDHEHSDECYEKELVCQEEADPTHTAHGWDCYEVDNAQVDEQAASGGKVVFDTLSFNETGTYVYRVYELNEGEANVEYDDAEYHVMIEVFINENNEMDTRTTILLNGDEVEGMEFRNSRKTPADPDDPTDPDNPDNLDDPSGPDEPDGPNKPGDPGKSTDSGKETDSDKLVPPTGDNVHLDLWLILLGVSVVGIAAILVVSRRRAGKNTVENKQSTKQRGR